MNVGQLKAAIGDLGDEAEVVVVTGVPPDQVGYITYHLPRGAVVSGSEAETTFHMRSMMRHHGRDFKHGYLLIQACDEPKDDAPSPEPPGGIDE